MQIKIDVKVLHGKTTYVRYSFTDKFHRFVLTMSSLNP